MAWLLRFGGSNPVWNTMSSTCPTNSPAAFINPFCFSQTLAAEKPEQNLYNSPLPTYSGWKVCGEEGKEEISCLAATLHEPMLTNPDYRSLTHPSDRCPLNQARPEQGMPNGWALVSTLPGPSHNRLPLGSFSHENTQA